MSRTFTPLRSIAASASRRTTLVQAGPVSRSIRFVPRYYSTESEATSSTASSDDLSKKVTELEAAKIEAEKKSTELEAKKKDLEKDLMYHKAEIQTLTRRVTDERAKASEFAITSFARSLLSTSDVLTTALKHVPKPIEPGTPLESLYNGVEMTQKAMFKTFSEAGVVKMEVNKGTVFDPNLHEATFQIPKEVAGPKEGGGEWGSGEVVEVGKEGWMIGNRVLRPAQVGVTQIE